MVRVVKKAEERRHEIVSVSQILFLRQGYENTKMEDVITKLQIAKGTIYHYFRSKEDLLDAVVEEMVAKYMTGVKTALNECQGNAIDKMRTLVRAGRIAPNQMDIMESLHCPDNTRMHVRLLAATLSSLAPLYAAVITQGCEEKVFRTEHPLECAEILLAGIQFVMDVGCYVWRQEDLERRAKAIPTLMENQLNAPKGTFGFLFDQI